MKKRIGDLYDKEKFNAAFDRAANAFVKNVMGEYADTDQGRSARDKAVAGLNEKIKNVPIELYQTIEAIADGKDVSDFAEFVGDGREKDYLLSQGDAVLIDIISSYKDGKWRVKDVKAAESYYNGLFRSEKEMDPSASKLKREELKPLIAKRLSEFDGEVSMAEGERQKLQAMMREEHARFIESKGVSPSSEAYRIMSKLYKEVNKENKTLARLEAKQVAARRKLIPYQVISEAGLLTKQEDAEYEKLARKELKVSGELDCYMSMIDEMNEVRFKNGLISETQYYMKHDGPRTPERNKPYINVSERVDISKSVKGIQKTTPIKDGASATELQKDEKEV